MIICKYTKLNEAAYFPHLDVLRTVGMAIRRTGLGINFSDGYNPHARLFFSQPLPLGTQSECEYFCADSNEDALHFMNTINTSLPKGIKILNANNTVLNPNPAALVFTADYKIECEKNLLKGIDFAPLLKQKELVIEFLDKGVLKQKDVLNQVFELNNDDSTIFFRLACGNVNLRAERLANHLLGLNPQTKGASFCITKTVSYDKDGNNLDKIFF